MKKVAIFNKEELKDLPFNYQYIEKKEGLPTKEEWLTKFNPVRKVKVSRLGTENHIVASPQKVISKIYPITQ
jgi:hypothetical protein